MLTAAATASAEAVVRKLLYGDLESQPDVIHVSMLQLSIVQGHL